MASSIPDAELEAAGATIAGGNVSGDIRDAAQGAQILAHDNVIELENFGTSPVMLTQIQSSPHRD